MTTLGRPHTPRSGLQDMARDWRRWSAAERTGAVMIMLFVVAMPAALWIVLHSAHSV